MRAADVASKATGRCNRRAAGGVRIVRGGLRGHGQVKAQYPERIVSLHRAARGCVVSFSGRKVETGRSKETWARRPWRPDRRLLLNLCA